MTDPSFVRSRIEAYYTGKVLRHGATPAGADWPSTPSLELRLVQLLKACDFSTAFSLNDLGCGYAATLDLIERRWPANRIDYRGIDLSADMVAHARGRWGSRTGTAFSIGHGCGRAADYSIASGIFNVKLDNDLASWESHVRATLLDMHQSSRIGFAVNFMLPGAAAQTPQLYGSAPDPWIAYCKSELGRSVEVLQGYGLPEYSLLAR